MTMDGEFYHAGFSPVTAKNPAPNDAGFIPIVASAGSASQIGQANNEKVPGDPRVLYRLKLWNPDRFLPGLWLLREGKFIQDNGGSE
jgi:hypothetical protein